MFTQPLAYFITFRTYGSWLHGDDRGSVDRGHNEFGSPLQPPSESRRDFEQELLRHAPVELSGEARTVFLDPERFEVWFTRSRSTIGSLR
jgi:hypothetical protein